MSLRHQTPLTRRSPLLSLLSLVSFALLLALGSASVASAHGGPGRLTVVSTTATGPRTYTFEVLLIFEQDGHGVPDATVAVAADGPAPFTPVTLRVVDSEAGRYSGSVTFPADGEWNVRISSVEPATSVTLPLTVGTTGAGTVGTTGIDTTGMAPTSLVTASTDIAAAPSAASGSGASLSPAPPTTVTQAPSKEESKAGQYSFYVVVTVVIAGVVLLTLRARRNVTPPK